MSFISLNASEVDLLSALLRQSLAFMIVGGRAVQFHGHHRAAKDLDIWYSPLAENPKRLIRALSALGIQNPEITEAYLSKPNVQFRLNGIYHTEFLTRVEGVVFEDAYRNRVSHSVKNISVPIISLQHLLETKRALARPQDLEDVQALEPAA